MQIISSEKAKKKDYLRMLSSCGVAVLITDIDQLLVTFPRSPCSIAQLTRTVTNKLIEIVINY